MESCRVSVIVPVESITFDNETHTMNVGEMDCLDYCIRPNNATNKSVTWCSSDPNVAVVNATSGVITAKSAGTTTITATTDDGSFVASCILKVSQVLNYPDSLITNLPTRESILKLKNMRDETINAFLRGKISYDAKEIAIQRIDYEINLVRADYIAVGTNPFSDYAYAVFGADKSADKLYPFKRELYYRPNNPFTGLDVMVVQRVLELYGFYEHDPDSLYGTWEQTTQDAALSFTSLLDSVNGKRIFNISSFNVLFQASNASQRTYESMRLLQQFNLQHKQVQINCVKSLLLSGCMARMEMPVKGSSKAGGTGRADIVANNPAGTYVWEVKHNSTSAIANGDAQIQRYIVASKTVPEQNAFYPNDLNSKYQLPLIAGPSVFSPTAVPWYGKYLLYKSYVSLNPYRNALIVYEESESVPNEYVLVNEPVAVVIPEPETSSSFDFTNAYYAITSFGEGVVRGMQIDSQTGEILVTILVYGTLYLMAFSVVAFVAATV